MKILPWILLIFGAIAVWLLWPQSELDDKRKKEYETAIAVLEAEKAEIQSRQDSSQKMVKDTIEAYKVVLGAQKRETAYWKEKSKEIRVIVKERIESDPDVLAFVQAQDSVIISLETENQMLARQALFNAQVFKDLIAMEIQEDRADSLMHWESQQRILGLEKEVKKVPFLKKVLLITGIVALVEAAYIGIKEAVD